MTVHFSRKTKQEAEVKYGKLSKMLFLGTDVTSFTIHSLAFFQIFSTVIFDFSVLLFHRFSLDLIRTKIESNSRWVAVKSLQLHYRDSHWSCSIRKYVPKNYVIFTEIHLCWSLLLMKRDSNICVFLRMLRNF